MAWLQTVGNQQSTPLSPNVTKSGVIKNVPLAMVDPLDRQWHMEVYWSMDDSTLIVPVHDAPRAGAREFGGQFLAFKP